MDNRVINIELFQSFLLFSFILAVVCDVRFKLLFNRISTKKQIVFISFKNQ